MQKKYEEIVERQRGIWEGHEEARRVIDCFAVELDQVDKPAILPVQTPPEPPKNTWLTKLRDRLKNPTPYKERYAGDRPSPADRTPNRVKDLHDVMQHATLAEAEQAIEDQRKYVEDFFYAHRDAEQLLNDIRVIKRGF